MAENKFGADTAYHSVSSADNDTSDDYVNRRPKIELGSHPQIKEKRAWWATMLWQTFALLWLVPIIALLYLNFTNFIIGASAWCPDGKCYLNVFNSDASVPQRRMKNFDKEDHNLLGGLQFVAKGLEVWFGIIAAALMYLITMIFAGKREGLPVGYLTRPMEFADVIALLDPLLWVTGPSPFGVNKPATEKKLGRRVWMLIGLSVFLCILINLMGPATAVLVIPALQWIETANVGTRQFSHLNSAQPPIISSQEGWFWWATPYCTENDFETFNYSCTQYPMGNSLDTWISSSESLFDGATGFASQSALTFRSNLTYQSLSENSLDQIRKANKGGALYSDVVWWAPSRQIISNLSVDSSAIAGISAGQSEERVAKGLENYYYYPDPISTYTEYNKSLQLQIRRNGPVMGTTMNKYVDYNGNWHYKIDVDANRQIRCYIAYNLWNAPMTEGIQAGNYTKCVRTGSGWSNENYKASFSVPGAFSTASKRQQPGVSVDIYSSDRAVFFPNGTLPSWLPSACLSRAGLVNRTNCDWERLFTTDPAPGMANRTQHVNTLEFTMKTGNFSTMMAVDFVAYLAFTEYTLDPFPFSNPLQFVETENLPDTGTAVAVNPAWLLAGWSVGLNGTMLSNRTTTNLLLDVMTRLSENPDEGVVLGLAQGDWKIDQISFVPVMHSLSLIDHATNFVPQGTRTEDASLPVLVRNARMYVWAYGLGSRTSYLGAAVAIAGALVVVWQFFLGLYDRRRYRSPTQLVVAALEHSPKGEFDGKQHDEKAMARVRFHINDDSGHAGKFSFYEADHSGPHVS